MSRMLFLPGLAFLCVVVGIGDVRGAGPVETSNMIVTDLTGKMSPERLKAFAAKTESTLAQVLQFWATGPGLDQYGKIRIELEKALPKASSSVYFMKKDKGRQVRIVRVYGSEDNPHQLAHKLTHALFPHSDKLIRNMMGIPSEVRFGNPASFPQCCFKDDEWVMAMIQAKTYVPLAELGPDHLDWGMEIHEGVPRVKDRAKQHAMYAVSGSFGEYAVRAFGTDKVKKFYRSAKQGQRPWKETFGIPLNEIETGWIEDVKSRARGHEKTISILVNLIRKDPVAACTEAQDLCGRKP
ncbi:MAG: hypothetical protein AB1512_30575 [Thermodesulfobacteriota bacterium]